MFYASYLLQNLQMIPEIHFKQNELDEQFQDMEDDSLSNLGSEQLSVQEMCNPASIETDAESIDKPEEENIM